MKTCIAAFVTEIMWMCVCCRRYIIMWCSCSSTLYFLLDIPVVASCFDGRHSGFGAGAGSGGLGTAEGSDGVSPGSTGLRKKKNQVMLSSWIYLLWYKKKKTFSLESTSHPLSNHHLCSLRSSWTQSSVRESGLTFCLQNWSASASGALSSPA